MSQLFLVNQKYLELQVQSDSQTADSSELVLFIEPNIGLYCNHCITIP